jgi:HEAT repeat protein
MHRRAHIFVPVLAGLLCTAGCADMNVRKTAATTPPGVADGNSYRNPGKQREALAYLSAEADELEPAEQQRVSAQLAHALAVEEDMLIREQVALALGGYRTEAALTGLRTALSDDDSNVRMAACRALGEHGEPAAVDLLASALSGDADVDVRLAAARALGTTESPQAVDGLVAVLGDADPALRRRATESLKAVTGEDFKDDVDAWRTYATKNGTGESAANITQQPTQLF